MGFLCYFILKSILSRGNEIDCIGFSPLKNFKNIITLYQLHLYLLIKSEVQSLTNKFLNIFYNYNSKIFWI